MSKAATAVLKHFAIFTGKQQFWSLFLTLIWASFSGVRFEVWEEGWG